MAMCFQLLALNKYSTGYDLSGALLDIQLCNKKHNEKDMKLKRTLTEVSFVHGTHLCSNMPNIYQLSKLASVHHGIAFPEGS